MVKDNMLPTMHETEQNATKMQAIILVLIIHAAWINRPSIGIFAKKLKKKHTTQLILGKNSYMIATSFFPNKQVLFFGRAQ